MFKSSAPIFCPVILFIFLFSVACSNALAEEEFRVWTSKVGTTLLAKLRSDNQETITLEKKDGTTLVVRLDSLSEFDKDFVGKTRQPDPFVDHENVPAPGVPPLPENFPKDELLETIPWLKKLKSKPVEYAFVDFATKTKITQARLKSKYVYMHTLEFSASYSPASILTELKLLHKKYGPKGFAIVSIVSNYQRSDLDRNSDKKGVEQFQQALIDYGVDWFVSYSSQTVNPLTKEISKDPSISWLIGPTGNLIHSKIREGYYGDSSLSLKDALVRIFGE